MTLFWITSSVIILSVLAMVIPTLLRTTPDTGDDQTDVNINLAQGRQRSLKLALAAEEISEQTYESELLDLQTALAIDLDTKNKGFVPRNGIVSAMLIAAFIPIATITMHLRLGDPVSRGVAISSNSQTNNTPLTNSAEQNTLSEEDSENEQEAMAAAAVVFLLEKQLADNPNDIQSWILLGRSYLSSHDYPEAETVLIEARSLNSENPDLLALLAEAVAMNNNGELQGRPANYLKLALEIDENHEQSNWLQGLANQQIGNHSTAIQNFEKILPLLDGDLNAQMTINTMIERSNTAMLNNITGSRKDTEPGAR